MRSQASLLQNSVGSRQLWPKIVLGAALLLTAHVRANGQERFASPGDAAGALVSAAKANDMSKVLAILGPAGRDIVVSGDAVADKNARAKFLKAYDAANRISNEGDNKAVLIIGEENWPFPIPVVRIDGRWQFDASAGRQEILFRRIGRNERNAIQVCLAYVDAQNDYARMDPQKKGVAAYAERFVSSRDKKDGLYWPAKDSEAASPLGELVAAAAREGYRPARGEAYYGYHYKMLRAQGSAAPGGAFDYVAHGNMIAGFALVAYPSAYRNSGVMTFIVNHDGTVFQKDLGPRTSQVAARMKSFNPDQTWQKVKPEELAVEKAK